MQKKLRKSADRKLFGVRGGIGEYLDIDPTVVYCGLFWIRYWAAPLCYHGSSDARLKLSATNIQKKTPRLGRFEFIKSRSLFSDCE